jgi:hypothetical protein
VKAAGRWTGGLLLLAAVAASLGMGEVGARLLLGSRLRDTEDERSLLYRYDERLGWFPGPGESREFRGARLIHVHHNADGFRDAEHGPSTRPRIAFVGDSFVWGYDVEASERFTDRLQQAHPEWEVLNLGVSGYGTDQEYLLLQQVLDRYRPSVVVLVFSHNDRRDNQVNLRYESYKPYFTAAREDGALELKGVPVPQCRGYVFRQYPHVFSSTLARGVYAALSHLWLPALVRVPDSSHDLVRAMRDCVTRRGYGFGVACAMPDRALMRLCRSQQIPSIVLQGEHYPDRGEHWTPVGHEQVAVQLSQFLQAHASSFGLN